MGNSLSIEVSSWGEKGKHWTEGRDKLQRAIETVIEAPMTLGSSPDGRTLEVTIYPNIEIDRGMVRNAIETALERAFPGSKIRIFKPGEKPNIVSEKTVEEASDRLPTDAGLAYDKILKTHGGKNN